MMVLAQHQILRVCCNSHMGILCIPRNWRRRPVRFLERHGEAADASVSGPRLLKCRGSTEQLAKELLLLVERKMKQTDSWRQSCEAEKKFGSFDHSSHADAAKRWDGGSARARLLAGARQSWRHTHEMCER